MNTTVTTPPLSRLLHSCAVVLMCSALIFAAGCSKPIEHSEEIRPVRTMIVSQGTGDAVTEFSGDVRARVESRLGFRVGGKIIARKVDVGTTVRRGQLLMQLDPQDLQLAQMQANAALRAAESGRDLALAELKRYRDLCEKKFVSQALLDSKESAYKSAQASYEQAAAALRNQSNQAGYANLLADTDGIVTAIEAEVGQVVAPGIPVVRVARPGEKEVVVGIPEDQVDLLRSVDSVKVRTWAQPDRSLAGKVREVSPVADPATRTYLARIAIPEAPDDVRLGMTAYVSFSRPAAAAGMRLPLSALHRDKDATSVWVVDNGAVRLVPVLVSGMDRNDVLISSGIKPGQTVVTAGVNLLQPNQKVRVLASASTAQAGSSNGISAEASK